jgi:hypothetical protein
MSRFYAGVGRTNNIRAGLRADMHEALLRLACSLICFRAYKEDDPPGGLPASPLAPRPEAIGVRWAA